MASVVLCDGGVVAVALRPRPAVRVYVARDGQVDLRRLTRFDLEALAALKLFEEVGASIEECRELIETASAAWLTMFLERGGERIGCLAIDPSMLARAREHAAQLMMA